MASSSHTPFPPLFLQRARREREELKALAGEPVIEANAAPEDVEEAPPQVPPPAPSVAEVIRRLRRLREPATLFGETEEQRWERLREAEATARVADEDVGGQQANMHVELEREAEQRERLRALEVAAADFAPDKAASSNPPTDGDKAVAVVDPETAKLEAAFRAAAAVAAEAALPVPERVAKRLRGWLQDWQADLDARPADAAATAEGRRATLRLEETRQYLKPLFESLAARDIEREVLAAVLLITNDINERNYLHAYELYMGLAIGNAAWPIGVTQVGLHDRSAREKISFKFNSSVAHVMNNEATRKYIQALKRIMTFCQRRYPTDPARSVDFAGSTSETIASGVAGRGSDKLALLEAEARGDVLAPTPAPALWSSRGAVKTPLRWDQRIRAAMEEVARDLDR